MMRAIVITAYGDAGNLAVQQRPVPTPRDGEVLVEVRAAGVNRPDIFQRKGNYPPPPGVVPDVPGLEVAGVVVACGKRVSRWVPGDRVCALVPGGGYAEYVAAQASHCLPIPDNLDFEAAACLPETVFTVWHNVFQLGALRQGETLLVHGGSGGIGTTAIQLAICRGAQVYATAGSPEKCAFCEQLGAKACFNYKQGDFADRLADQPIDVILDSIGAPYFDQHMALLAEGGRLVFINAVGGRQARLDVLAVMRRRLTLTGSTLRGRSIAFKRTLCESVERHVWPLVNAGRVVPIVHEAFPMADAGRAHQRMEAGDFMGKLVLTV